MTQGLFITNRTLISLYDVPTNKVTFLGPPQESISSPEAELPQPLRSVLGAEEVGTRRATINVIKPGLGTGCVIVFRKVSIACVLEQLRREIPIRNREQSFG